MALHRPAHIGRRVTGSDGDGNVGCFAARGLDVMAQSDQGRAQVAVDVVGECLQRRHIKDATALRLRGHGLGGQPVEAPKEGGQGLAAAGRRGHEDVAARRDFLPAAFLHVRGAGERGFEPVPRSRREEVE